MSSIDHVQSFLVAICRVEKKSLNPSYLRSRCNSESIRLLRKLRIYRDSPPPPLDVDHCHTMNDIQQNELRPRKMKNLSVICALVLCFPCCLIRYYRYVPRPILTPQSFVVKVNYPPPVHVSLCWANRNRCTSSPWLNCSLKMFPLYHLPTICYGIFVAT